MLLEDLVKSERRILVDTSILPHPQGEDFGNLYNQLSEEVKRLKYIRKYLTSENSFIIPEILKEMNEFKWEAREKTKNIKRIPKSMYYDMYLKKIRHLTVIKGQILEELIDNLGILDLTGIPAYELFKSVIYCLQDRFKIKKPDSNSRRSDEATIAAAMFFSAFGSGRTAILSDDTDFFNLLIYAINNTQKFNGLSEKVFENLRQEDHSIVLYSSSGYGHYRARLNTQTYIEIRDPKLTSLV